MHPIRRLSDMNYWKLKKNDRGYFSSVLISRRKPTESLIFSVGFLILFHTEAEKSYTKKMKEVVIGLQLS